MESNAIGDASEKQNASRMLALRRTKNGNKPSGPFEAPFIPLWASRVNKPGPYSLKADSVG